MNLTRGQIDALANIIMKKQTDERNEKRNAFLEENKEFIDNEVLHINESLTRIPQYIIRAYIGQINMVDIKTRVENELLKTAQLEHDWNVSNRHRGEIIDQIHFATIDTQDMEQLKAALGID